MSTRAALLFLSVAAASALTVQSSCRSLVHCPCGKSGGNITVCFQENGATENPCKKWAGCKKCQDGLDRCLECPDGFEGPVCEKAALQKTKDRRKRQYASSMHHQHRAAVQSNRVVFRNGPTGSAAQQGVCHDIDSPKLGSIRCVFDNRERICTGTCLPGYNFENRESESEMVLRCHDGHWTPLNHFPPCKSGGHCDLEIQGAGSYNCTKGMRGTRCDVHCANQYKVRYRCYPGKPWDPPLPYCVRPKGGRAPEDVRQPCRCEYGGSCDKNGRCVCPAGRTGTFCEILERRTCNDPGFIPNGYRKNMDGKESTTPRTFEEGESVVFGCRSRDYALQGSSILTCGEDGTWSEPLPECIKQTVSSEVMCSDPGHVPNGDRLNSDGSLSLADQMYPAGQSVRYTCLPGFVLQHQSVLTCLASGSWSSGLPYCRRIRSTTTTAAPDSQLVHCQDPGVDANGIRNPVSPPSRRGFPQGSSLQYICNENYDLNGERQLFCLTSGKWSSSVPTCVEQSRNAGDDFVYCLNPGSTKNGRITYLPHISNRRTPEATSLDPDFPEGARLQYFCNSGYILQGSSILTCEETGEWSSERPTCSQGSHENCENPGRITNGQIVLYPASRSRTRGPSPFTLEDPEYPRGTRLQYRCNSGFTLDGRSSITCEASGIWSADPPICRRGTGTSSDNIQYCKNPGPVANGKMVHSPSLNERTRQPGSASDVEEFPEGSRLQYSCDAGYDLQGTQTLTCRSSGVWSATPPTCITVSVRHVRYCDNPGTISNGRIRYYPPASSPRSASRVDIEDIPEFPQDARLEYSCDDGYSLVGNFALSCEPNGRWSSSPPTCTSGCGRSFTQAIRKITHGTKTLAGEWPWVVAIAVQEGNTSVIKCGGALLNSRTIVTAAHCLTIANSFIVYLGKFHLLDRNDDAEVMRRKSEKIIIHPNYNRGTMDSDIGLLTFAPRIRFTERIQPVCLPSPETTAKDLMTGKRGYVTGWGLTERRLPSEDLLLAHLPVLTNDACIDSYRKQDVPFSMTSNMYCAGFEEGGQSVCRGDSGSPMVFYDKQNEKHTMEGLVSFGVVGQCGLPGRYSVFTKVIRFVPWILRNT